MMMFNRSKKDRFLNDIRKNKMQRLKLATLLVIVLSIIGIGCGSDNDSMVRVVSTIYIISYF